MVVFPIPGIPFIVTILFSRMASIISYISMIRPTKSSTFEVSRVNNGLIPAFSTLPLTKGPNTEQICFLGPIKYYGNLEE